MKVRSDLVRRRLNKRRVQSASPGPRTNPQDPNSIKKRCRERWIKQRVTVARTRTRQQWPLPTRVISLRAERFTAFQDRLGRFAHHAQLWPATDGRKINRADWVKKGLIEPGNHLRRGEVGCYDSHVRLWQWMVDQELPYLICCEDDANIKGDARTLNLLWTALEEAEEYKIPFHILYLGTNREFAKRRLSPHLYEPLGCQGAFMYILSLEGARFYLERCRPYKDPVDMFMIQADAKRVTLYPYIGYVVPVKSDTKGIA